MSLMCRSCQAVRVIRSIHLRGQITRNTLLVVLTLTWAYSTFCAVMVLLDRTGRWRWFKSVWSPDGLSEIGLAYRRKHFITVVVGALLVAAWFVLVDPH